MSAKRAKETALAVGVLRTAVLSVETARELLKWNRSVYARLGWVAEEIRQTAMAFEPKGEA